MSEKLIMNIKFNIKENNFEIESNIKEEKRAEIIYEYLRTQFGRGVDNSLHIDRDIYTIVMELDLSFDKFIVKDNTGNKGLRDGLLAYIAEKLSNEH